MVWAVCFVVTAALLVVPLLPLGITGDDTAAAPGQEEPADDAVAAETPKAAGGLP